MANINAGASASILLLAGYQLRLRGNGIATRGQGVQRQIAFQGSQTMGPFANDHWVYLTAIGNVTYLAPSADVANGKYPCCISGAVLDGVTMTVEVADGYNIASGQFYVAGSPSGSAGNSLTISDADRGKAVTFVPVGIPYTTPANVLPIIPSVATATVFDSTLNYAAGDQVIYAGSRYQFNAPHPAGNWIGSDAIYQAYVSGVANTWGMYKQLGNQDDFLSGTIEPADIAAPTVSRGGKLMVEAPWTRARMIVLQREGRYKRGEQFSIASTESAAINTLSAAYDVTVGGVTTSVLYNASTAPQGFRRLTFGGQPASPVQIPALVTLPSQGHTAVSSYEFSDIINSVSVPPATGNRPLMVWRESRIVAAGDQSSSARNTRLIGNYNKFSGGQTYGRLALNQQIGSNGDMVADPTLAKSGTMLNPASGGSWPNVAFMFDHGVPSRVLAAFGDSITEAYNWWQDAVNSISTPASPFTFFNYGESGDASAQYLAALRLMIRDSRFQFTDILVPTFSPNEPTGQTDTTTGVLETALMDAINACVARGLRVYVWTSYSATTSRFSGNPTAVAAIQAYNQRMRVRAAAANAPFKLIEIETGFDVPTMVSDGTHPNATGQDFMRARAITALQRT